MLSIVLNLAIIHFYKHIFSACPPRMEIKSFINDKTLLKKRHLNDILLYILDWNENNNNLSVSSKQFLK